MAVASTVTVNITAETAKFVNGLKKAQKQSKSFGQLVSKSMKVAAASTAVFGVALIALTKQSLRVVDQQTKMAQRLGLSQRALAGLTLAAEQTGSSQQNLQLALQRSTRRIAEAATGTGEAVKALKELGVEAKELSKLTPDKQFIALSDAFAKVEGQSNKVRLGFKLFDSEGVGLINTLALGADGIQGFIDKSEKLGVALTDNQTRAITEANDEIGIMKAAFTGLGNQIAARTAPLLKAAAGTVVNLTTRVTQAIPKWAAWAASIFNVERNLRNLSIADMDAEIDLLLENIDEVKNEIERIQAQWASSTFDASELIEFQIFDAKLQKLLKRYNDVIDARSKLQVTGEVADVEGTGGDGSGSTGIISPEALRQQQQFTAAIKATATPLELLHLQLEEIRASLKDNPLWTADLAGRQSKAAVDAYLAELKRIEDEQAAIADGQKANFDAAAAAVATPLETLKKTLAQIRHDLETNPFWTAEVASRQASAAVDAYKEELERLEDETNDVFANMSEFGAQAARNMQDIFADFLFDPFEDGLKGMLKAFVEMIRRMVAELLAAELLKAFFSAFGGAFGAGTGSVIAPAPGPPAAIGGTRAGGRPVLVGERGPELFTPGATGAIRPLGAVSVTQENNFGGGGGLDIATLLPILEENNKKVKADILDSFDRGAYA